MSEEKKTAPEEQKPEPPAPEAPGGPPAPEQGVIPGMEGSPAPEQKVIDLSSVRMVKELKALMTTGKSQVGCNGFARV